MSFELFQVQPSRVKIESFYKICPDVMAALEKNAAAIKSISTHGRCFQITTPISGSAVTEMLPYHTALSRELGVPNEWWILSTSHEYLRLCQKIFKAIHSDGGQPINFNLKDTSLFSSVAAHAKSKMQGLISERDTVILHDPHPLPLVEGTHKISPNVIWRCHMGCDLKNPATDAGWNFLKPYLVQPFSCYIFTKKSFAPEFIDAEKLFEVHPAIHPMSWRNMPLTEDQVKGIYDVIVGRRPDISVSDEFNTIQFSGPARIIGHPPEDPLHSNIICQISWWDRIKDHIGVFEMFVNHFQSFPPNTYLMLLGPKPDPSVDNPETLNDWHDLLEIYNALPENLQQHVAIMYFTYNDRAKDSLAVNAIQRLATVALHKPLQEGFGLSVTEAMWKGLPVIGSAVGGITEQVIHEQTGLLLSDPRDSATCAAYIRRLLADPQLRKRLGENAKKFVSERYLIPHLLERHFEVGVELYKKYQGAHNQTRTALGQKNAGSGPDAKTQTRPKGRKGTHRGANKNKGTSSKK